MKTKLALNLKKLRKERHITQEDLALAMNVSVGAIYKWESNLSLPDIHTIMDLANFFSISVDSLIGFDGIDTSINKLLADINEAKINKRYSEAMKLMEKALVLYPNNLKVLYQAARLIEINALDTLKGDMKLFDSEINRAIRLLKKAKLYISDSDLPRQECYKIEMALADLYLDLRKPERAIEILKENNVSGVNDANLAFIFASGPISKRGEAELYLTKAFRHNIDQLFVTLIGYLNYFNKLNNKDRELEALDLMIRIITDLKGDNNVFYMEKYLGYLYFKRAEIYDKKKMAKERDENIKLAGEAIAKYDSNETPTNKDIKFYLKSEVIEEVLDDIGPTAYSVLESHFLNDDVDSSLIKSFNELMNN